MQVELDDAFVAKMRAAAKRNVKGMGLEDLLKTIYQVDDLEGLRRQAADMVDTLPVEQVIKIALGNGTFPPVASAKEPYTGKKRGRRTKAEIAADAAAQGN